MKKLFTGFLFFSVMALNICQCFGEEIQDIRIGILSQKDPFIVSSPGGLNIFEKASSNNIFVKKGSVTIAKSGGGIVVNEKAFSSPLVITSLGKGLLSVNGKTYRGGIRISNIDQSIEVINELDIEEYLYGVVPKEVVSSWPQDALRAQAVISRTYALKNLEHHGKKGYDLCDDVHCQVYGGFDCETEQTNKAVDDTKGEVLLFEGKLANTFFHGSCGGYTENIENVWGSKAPEYLRGRRVQYANSPLKDSWKNTLSEEYIRTKLTAGGYEVWKIDQIRISGRNSSGRARDVKISGQGRTITIPASKFRMTVDSWKIKSTMFKEIKKIDNNFVFSGLGWGHGVGLCQTSAKNMAQKGYSFSKILKYFYPGTYLARWDEQEGMHNNSIASRKKETRQQKNEKS